MSFLCLRGTDSFGIIFPYIISLLISGKIIYTDKNGLVNKIIEEQFAYCDVTLVENEEKVDGSITVQKFSDTNKFDHTFLIDSIEILSRDKSIVSY